MALLLEVPDAAVAAFEAAMQSETTVGAEKSDGILLDTRVVLTEV